MKTIKMTRKNLERHLSVSDQLILTIRDESKLKNGESCHIEGLAGEYSCVWQQTIHPKDLIDYARLTGFKKSVSDSPYTLGAELQRIYPDATKYVVHALLKSTRDPNPPTPRLRAFKILKEYCNKNMLCNPAECYGCPMDMIAHSILGAPYLFTRTCRSTIE